MAFHMHGDVHGHEDDLDAVPLADINVTPLVDVMLVLLIIFMVAAPLMTAGVPVQLPKTQATKVSQPHEPIIVSVAKDGGLFVGKDPVDPAALNAHLRTLAAADPTKTVLVRGDKDVPYGRVMEAMGQIGSAGFAKVSLIAQAPDSAPVGAPSAPPPAVGAPAHHDH